MPKMTTKAACELARSLKGVSEKDHFGGDAFYANKRIFATVWHEKNEVNLMLSAEQQRQLLATDGEAFVEIDNAWGRQGWTKVQLAFVSKSEFGDALKAAWSNALAARSRMKSTPRKARTSAPAKNSRN